jgi:hypothetical protein
MRLVFTAALLLISLAAIGLVGVALFAELPAPSREITLPVEAR